MQKLISIDLKADFGFFRKPDVNSGINLSYNMLHKPALLGILGAIIGLEGYKKLGELPEYYQKLKDLKVGIEPLEDFHERGNFKKTVIKYSNTIGYANKGTNYLTEEATLIKPAYRVYLLLELENKDQEKLYEYLRDGKAEYLPYFGKNEFSAWWENFTPHEIEKLDYKNDFSIESLICLEEDDKRFYDAIAKSKSKRKRSSDKLAFIFFERIPTSLEKSDASLEIGKKARYGYNQEQKFVFTDALLSKDNEFDLVLYKISKDKTVHLF